MVDRVRIIKQESGATGGNPADEEEFLNSPGKPNEDAPDVRGVFIQNDTSTDTSTFIGRDVSNNMTFTDGVVGTTYTLTQLAASGSANYDKIMLSMTNDSVMRDSSGNIYWGS